MRRENKNLTNEIKDLNEQLGAGGRMTHDVAKKVRLLNMEKDEITHSLNDAESALEVSLLDVKNCYYGKRLRLKSNEN